MKLSKFWKAFDCNKAEKYWPYMQIRLGSHIEDENQALYLDCTIYPFATSIKFLKFKLSSATQLPTDIIVSLIIPLLKQDKYEEELEKVFSSNSLEKHLLEI